MPERKKSGFFETGFRSTGSPGGGGTQHVRILGVNPKILLATHKYQFCFTATQKYQAGVNEYKNAETMQIDARTASREPINITLTRFYALEISWA